MIQLPLISDRPSVWVCAFVAALHEQPDSMTIGEGTEAAMAAAERAVCEESGR